MKFMCWFVGHNWLYSQPSRRKCYECKRDERLRVTFITINGVTVRKDVWQCPGHGSIG